MKRNGAFEIRGLKRAFEMSNFEIYGGFEIYRKGLFFFWGGVRVEISQPYLKLVSSPYLKIPFRPLRDSSEKVIVLMS